LNHSPGKTAEYSSGVTPVSLSAFDKSHRNVITAYQEVVSTLRGNHLANYRKRDLTPVPR